MIISAAHFLSSSVALDSYDTVIVGGGTLGLLIASDLVNRGQNVCVLEAGDRVARVPDGIFATGNSGKQHAGTTLGRAIGLGGTSTLWGGQLALFTPDDLVRTGHEWPLQYDELRPWYDTACAVLGIAPLRSSEDYLRVFGVAAPPKGQLEPFFTAWLPEPNMARLFRSEIEDARMHVILGACAHAFDFECDRAEKVHVATQQGATFAIAARHVILAAGTIGNVQLMLSASRHGPVPWGGNKLVGSYFHDHLGAKAASVEIVDDVAFRRMFENGIAYGTKLQPKLRAKIRSPDQPAVCGFFAFRSSLADKVSEIKRLGRSVRAGLSYSDLLSLPRATISFGRILTPVLLRYLRQRRVMALYDQGIDFMVQSEQWPIAHSRIVAAGYELGPTGLLPVALDWRLDGREASAIANFVKLSSIYLEDAGFARLRPEPWLTSGPPGLSATEDTYHQSGGLRMGSSAATGVTDKNAKVFGTANVSVAGASILPSSSYANSTFTAMALGLRLAERISQHSF